MLEQVRRLEERGVVFRTGQDIGTDIDAGILLRDFDAAVLCTYAFEFNQDYVEEMQAICQYRLGTAVKHLVVSGTGMSLSSETSQTEYSMVPGALIREKCSFPFSGVSCHYALDPQDLECLGASVLRELTENL